MFPSWVPFGCGTAAIVLLVVLIAGAAAMSSGGFGSAFEMLISSMQSEIDKMMTPDVTPAQKTALDAEMKRLREAVGASRLKLDRLQPLMRTMRKAVLDEKVTPAEVEELTKSAHAVNSQVRP